MASLLEILNKTTEYFLKCGIPDPRLDAQYIMAKGLGMSRMDLYLNFDRPLTERELDILRPLVYRRGKREPLQHILGNTSFRGHEIICDRRALVPRQETEYLVEIVLRDIAHNIPKVILDMGTGSGAIAVAIAKERPLCKVIATDISSDALALAWENVIAHQLQDRVELVLSDGLESIRDRAVDLIVSNPPYVASRDVRLLQPEVSVYDPPIALDGGADGLEVARRFLRQIAEKFPGVPVFFELGGGQPVYLIDELAGFAGNFWKEKRSMKDLQGVERFLILR